MSRRALAALGIAAFVAFLLLLLPARFVAERIARATDGAVQVHDAAGTAWKGSGRVVVATPAGPFAVESVEWRLLPLRLLAGRAAYAVHAATPDFELSGEIGRSWSAWEIPRLALAGRAAGAASFFPLLAPWRPEGELDVSLSGVALRPAELRGRATLEWRAAALAISEVRPLGTYRVEISGEGGPARLAVTTAGGALHVRGEGTFTPPSRLAFRGEARAEAAAADRLKPLLDLIGPARPDGARALELVVNAP